MDPASIATVPLIRKVLANCSLEALPTEEGRRHTLIPALLRLALDAMGEF